MGEESAGQGGQGSEPRSGWIDEAYSRFEAAWQAGQQPQIEKFLPAESPDKSETTLRNLLVQLVGIDLEWRWKTAHLPAETQSFVKQAAYPDVSESTLLLPRRPRLADYVARYSLLGPVEQLPNDLIVNEYYARSCYGDQPTHAEYLNAFGSGHPELAKQLQATDEGIAAAEHLPSNVVPEDGSPLGATVQNLGDYDLLEKLGEGGMGVVFKAQHRRMKRLVAIKMIARREIGSPDAVKRFYREVEAAAKLNHSNIVQAYDAREHDGVHYLVMEYVEGKDLAAVVKQRGPLPIAQAVDYVIQAARGLQYAHKHQMVHRDIKPSNLILDTEGTVKILDMGLARIAGLADDGGQDRLTGSGQMMGTCDYMAPEQALDSHHADARADIYSLGCTLYRLLTGHVPYQGETLIQVLLAHRESPTPSLCQDRPDVPPQLDAMCRKMVAKKPEDRYQSMTAVIAALETCVGGRGVTATSVGEEATAAFPMADNPDFLNATSPGNLATAAKRRSSGLPNRPYRNKRRLRKPANNSDATRNSWWLRKKITLAVDIGLGVAGFIVLAAIISVYTSKGTLEIVSDDPNVQVAAKQNGEVVEVVDAKSGWKITLKSGQYELATQGSTDKFQFDQDSVVVKRGDTVKVKVTLKRSPPISNLQTEISGFKSPLPAIGSLIGPDGKWKLPPGAPPPAVAPFDAKKAKDHQEAWAKHLGVPVEITNSIGMKLVLIPPGEFMMGSPKELIEEELKVCGDGQWFKEHLPGEAPRHCVRITRPFYLGMYLVTQEEYQRVTGANPSGFSVTGMSKDKVADQDTKRFPVESVSWWGADDFCSRLSEMAEEKLAGRRYRLPSEAQWEYACRAGSTGRWFFSAASTVRTAAEEEV